MKSAKIRQPAGSEGDFEVVVTDPLLGAFALHSGFDIDVHEADAGWRRVSLEELKGFLRSRYLLPADDLPKASQIAECRLFARVDDIKIPNWKCGRLSVLGREEACVRYGSESYIEQAFRTWSLVRHFSSRALRLLVSR